MSSAHEKLPLLWFLTGTIGDALMALALSRELAELNGDSGNLMFVRREPGLVRDLAGLVPGVQVAPASFSPAGLVAVARALARPWQIMSAWKSVGLRRRLRALFLLNPRTRVARFDFHEAATNRDAVAPYDMQKLVIDNFRALAQAAGLNTKPLGSPASLPLKAVMPKNFNLAPGSYIVLHPLGSNAVKSLPPARATDILKALAAAYPELSFVVTGGPGDGAVIDSIIKGVPRARAAVNLPILEVAGLIKNAALYLGVDTGITHLSAMMGKETLALEHPTMPRWFPTYNPKTVMLISAPDPREGVWGVTDEAVLAAAANVRKP